MYFFPIGGRIANFHFIFTAGEAAAMGLRLRFGTLHFQGGHVMAVVERLQREI